MDHTTTPTKYAQLIELVERVNALSADILEDTKKQISALEEKEQKWKKIETLMEENVARAEYKIVLDVGGKRFATSKDTLLSIKDTYFTGLLGSGRWKPDKDGTYFIDRNGKLFTYVLEYLRTGELSTEGLNAKQKKDLRKEMDYYMRPTPSTLQVVHEEPILSPPKVSDILSREHTQQIEQWTGGKRIGERLWKATEHGFGVGEFHSRCDNKGPTLVVIQSSNGHIFGGYTDQSWNGNNHYIASTESFLFTLTSPYGDTPTKFIITQNEYAIFAYSDYGPIFGGGNDMHICDNSNTTAGSHFNFPHSYQDTTSIGHLLFTGAKFFTTKEVEVYSIK